MRKFAFVKIPIRNKSGARQRPEGKALEWEGAWLENAPGTCYLKYDGLPILTSKRRWRGLRRRGRPRSFLAACQGHVRACLAPWSSRRSKLVELHMATLAGIRCLPAGWRKQESSIGRGGRAEHQISSSGGGYPMESEWIVFILIFKVVRHPKMFAIIIIFDGRFMYSRVST